MLYAKLGNIGTISSAKISDTIPPFSLEFHTQRLPLVCHWDCHRGCHCHWVGKGLGVGQLQFLQAHQPLQVLNLGNLLVAQAEVLQVRHLQGCARGGHSGRRSRNPWGSWESFDGVGVSPPARDPARADLTEFRGQDTSFLSRGIVTNLHDPYPEKQYNSRRIKQTRFLKTPEFGLITWDRISKSTSTYRILQTFLHFFGGFLRPLHTFF